MGTFTPELTFGPWQSGIMSETPGISYRTIQRNDFSPLSLFTGGFVGVWYDPSDLSSMFQDTAGTTPAVVNSGVARINDKSGGNNHALQATGANQPILRQDGTQYYLEFDGTKSMVTAGNVNMTSASLLTIYSASRVDSAAAHGYMVYNGAGAGGALGGFLAMYNFILAANAPATGVLSDGVASTNVNITTVAAVPRLEVLTFFMDPAGATSLNEIAIRSNGAVAATTAASGPISNMSFANSPVTLGANLIGRIYGLAFVGKTSGATEYANMEAYLNGKCGAY